MDPTKTPEPPSRMERKGQQVINAIVSGALITVRCPDAPESACVVTWKHNAAEQIGAMFGRCLARAGEPEYANIVRNRSGQDAGELDFNVAVELVENLSPADKAEIVRVARAMAKTVEDWAGPAANRNRLCRCGRDLIFSGPADTDPWCSGCNMSAAVCDCVSAEAKR